MDVHDTPGCTSTSSDLVDRLKHGNEAYRRSATYRKQRELTKGGQAPCVLVVSCSDSRVPIPIIFANKDLGQFFEVRTAGQAMSDTDLESIFYAVEHLKPKLLIVLGHTHCGAVTAAAHAHFSPAKEGEATLFRQYPGIIRQIIPSVHSVLKRVPETKSATHEFIQEVIHDNAEHRAAQLRDIFKFGRTEVDVVSAVYDIETGVVDFHSS